MKREPAANIEEIEVIKDGILTKKDLTPYSDYYGVVWTWEYRMWKAFFRYENHIYKIGYYQSEAHAAMAYNTTIESERVYGEYTPLVYNYDVIDLDVILKDIQMSNIYHEKKDCIWKPRVPYGDGYYYLGGYRLKSNAVLVYNCAIRALYGQNSDLVHKLNGQEI